MANVRRAVLIDVPAPVAYEGWLAVDEYPSFMRDLAAVRPEAGGSYLWVPADDQGEPFSARLAGREPNRLISWESDRGPWRRLSVTFAPLSGPSTWVICIAEVPLSDETNAVQLIDRLSAQLQKALLQFRALVEEYWGKQPNGSASRVDA